MNTLKRMFWSMYEDWSVMDLASKLLCGVAVAAVLLLPGIVAITIFCCGMDDLAKRMAK